MIVFPNAKINIGLNVVAKRNDGFHNLETVFYPTQLCDVLEIVKSDRFEFTQTGITIDGNIEQNLIVKAFRIMQQNFNLPEVKIHLHKIIPLGAGIGGGSSNAAFTLTCLNDLFNLEIDTPTLIQYASQLGSDCAFFILNQAAFATGRGEKLTPIQISLSGYHLVLVKPNISVSTTEAFSGIQPKLPDIALSTSILKAIEEWSEFVKNDFETSIFKHHPQIEELKKRMYQEGALYASMSGSGSSVFGIFKDINPSLKSAFPNSFFWNEKCL